jgi:hypothetical protein
MPEMKTDGMFLPGHLVMQQTWYEKGKERKKELR